jgi:hypothetical protein
MKKIYNNLNKAINSLNSNQKIIVVLFVAHIFIGWSLLNLTGLTSCSRGTEPWHDVYCDYSSQLLVYFGIHISLITAFFLFKTK